MKTTIVLPSPLRSAAGGSASIQSEGATVGDALAQLAASHPTLHARLMGEDGNVRRFIKLFVNGEDLRTLDGNATKLNDGDEIRIVQAVAGG